MPAWRCPKCDRQFGRKGQGHECAPAMTIEEYFATGPAHERPVFEAVMACLAHIGDIHVEPVSVGIFLKRARTFAELRPMQRWVAVSCSLRHAVTHPTMARKVVPYSGRFYTVFNIRSPGEVDDRIGAWLAEAYLDSPE